MLPCNEKVAIPDRLCFHAQTYRTGLQFGGGGSHGLSCLCPRFPSFRDFFSES